METSKRGPAVQVGEVRLPISAIVPAFNRGILLDRALRSIAAQTRPPREVIVVDDCSTDRTAMVAAEHGARLIRHTSNLGAAAARNTALLNATQDWVAPLDSDDEWLPLHLETLWGRRDGHVLVAGSWIDREASRNVRCSYRGPASGRETILRSPAQIVVPGNPLSTSGVIVRRRDMVAVGGYDTSLRYAEDWDLWIRLLERGTALHLPDVLSVYHHHPSQKSGDAGGGPQGTWMRILEKYAGRHWASPALIDRRVGGIAWDAFRAALAAGDRREGLRQAGCMMGSPNRAIGVALLLVSRKRLRLLNRRRACRMTASGAAPPGSLE